MNRTAARFVPATRNALAKPRVVMMPAVSAAPNGAPGKLDCVCLTRLAVLLKSTRFCCKREIVVVVRLRVRNVGRGGRAHVHDVAVQHLVERHVVAHHADDGRRRIVQVRIHGTVAIRPRRGELAHRRVVERGIRRGVERCAERIAAGDSSPPSSRARRSTEGLRLIDRECVWLALADRRGSRPSRLRQSKASAALSSVVESLTWAHAGTSCFPGCRLSVCETSVTKSAGCDRQRRE